MRHSLLFLALTAFAGSASAGSMSSTITLASDYLFDGVSQTQGDGDSKFNPALQVSLDYEWDNGFYLGVWGSNVDFGDEDEADVEIDWYGGYYREYESGWAWNVGFANYAYLGVPGEGYDYLEWTVGVTLPVGTEVSLWVSKDDDVFNGEAYRVKGKHSIDLGNDYSLDLEATYTDKKDLDEDYFHGQLGVSRPLGPFTAYLGYSDTDINDDPVAEGRFLFTLSTTVDLF